MSWICGFPGTSQGLESLWPLRYLCLNGEIEEEITQHPSCRTILTGPLLTSLGADSYCPDQERDGNIELKPGELELARLGTCRDL